MQKPIKKKISVDFDGTLTDPAVQLYIKQLLIAEIDVWVVTTRFATYGEKVNYEFANDVRFNYEWTNNRDLYKVITQLGIPWDRVVFTNYEWKDKFFVDKTDFIWHLDNTLEDVKLINKNTKTVGIMYKDTWKDKCNRLLVKNDKVFKILNRQGYQIKKIIQSTENQYQIFYIEDGSVELNYVLILNDHKIIWYGNQNARMITKINVEKFIKKFKEENVRFIHSNTSPVFKLIFKDVVAHPNYEQLKTKSKQIYFQEYREEGQNIECWLEAHKQLLKEINE